MLDGFGVGNDGSTHERQRWIMFQFHVVHHHELERETDDEEE